LVWWKRAGWLLVLAAGLCLGACRAAVEPPDDRVASETRPRAAAVAASTIQLRDVTADSGIAFRHSNGASGRMYLVEAMSAGLALFDYDGDGLVDLYLVNGAPLPPQAPDASVTSGLYRNEGQMRFRDVTREAGVGSAAFGLGAVAGDFDNDGDADLYVSNFGPNALYRNNGDGTFTDATSQAGVGVGDHFGAGASFLDADGDGNLDLLAANYVIFSLAGNLQKTVDGFPSYPGPQDFEPARSVFFKSGGDGTFRDVSQECGLADAAGTGMGVIAADYDNDRDTDLFVANDEMGSFLFENDGGRFSEVGLIRGFAYGLDGRARGNMGLDCADYDNDGWLDFFVTTYSNESCVLFRNVKGRLEDVTAASGAGAGSLPHAKWGTGFADLDNDGDRDLVLACGHLEPEVHRFKPYTAYRVANVLLENAGDGRFVDISARCGNGLAPIQSSRGTGLDDLDNDGDVDLVVLNAADRPTVARNETRAANHWLQIELLGRQSNRDGAGAQVRITAGGRTQLDEVHAGRGYQSHHGTRLHFGLGSAQEVERIEVRWIGGPIEVIDNVAADQLVTILEGSGQVVTQGR
jgi:hypothetical protein